ncbi:uncharacterized protein RHIMIDRAFT_239526 [Rhizopus microsporus ATCC 52813]|uniref:PiggyBac transposable element-derived protein domain-containing protein n=1 Tax=Rhizopus microsporus ATCC 52813 TaxID=1340429 RepID=A0A2G4SPK5_RHIZD|nr:uncharacterized protein RHIMIDRAFT_239526 [Rhizopus microsporus ATCC 52813]PHZ10704.1 hypothetical protein RHIMIDRAFT_239526 [Rhizopus microsporus ATCC 52813]
MYNVLLDEANGHILKLSEGAIKYVGPLSIPVAQEIVVDTNVVEAEGLLEDTVDEDEEKESIDLTSSRGWTVGEAYMNFRLSGSAEGFTSLNSRLMMNNGRYVSSLDYFLFFLPVDHVYSIIHNTSLHARSLGYWEDITFHEYLIKAHWRQDQSFFLMNVDFSQYMSFNRFSDIMKMHVFEIPSKQAQELDPLYQIRSTIQAFNDHMPKCIIPGKYLVIDDSMNQWLGASTPNLKKVPRKPHPIGQEFKTLADNHCYCILRVDTVSDPCPKEFDKDPGIKKLRATVKRLVKPWFDSGRTVITDPWFSSPDMISMLMNHGHYSIMQVTKRRY